MNSSVLIVFSVFMFSTAFAGINPYQGSSFSEVWNRITNEEYDKLPHYSIVTADTLKALASVAMNATLDDRNDFRARRIKLVHPNGICLAGTWEIDQKSEFSGYFSKDRKGLVVARASATQDFVNENEYRAFGLAVKLFPTLNPDEKVYTSNLFSVDNIEGVKNRKFVDTVMTNQIPDFNFINLGAVIRLFSRMPFLINFNNLSKQADSGPKNRNPLFRRTVEVARAGISREYSATALQDILPSYKELSASNNQVNEPTWVAFQADRVQVRSNEKDFRNETFDLVRKNGTLKYKIFVADKVDESGKKNWAQIGSISFDTALASKPCDLDLHFHHPRTDN